MIKYDHKIYTGGCHHHKPRLCFRSFSVSETPRLLLHSHSCGQRERCSGLCNIYQHLESIPGPVAGYEGSVRGSRCGEYLSVAHQVCQSVEYFLRDDMLLAGPLSVSPALGIVLDSLRNRPGHGPEIAWIQSALEVVRRKGLRVLQDFKL